MGPLHSLRAHLAGAALALLGGACQLAAPRVHNLEQVHQPDGRPKRDAHLLNDLTWLADRVMRSSNFGGEEFQTQTSQAKRIKDPLGTCLANVCALARCERDQVVAGLQAATFGWLAVDCTSPLSRERCLLALGELAPLLPAVPPLDPEAPVATPEEVKEVFDALVATTKEVLAAPALAGNSLSEACLRAGSLKADRAGTVRLLRAVNAILAQGERGAVRAPLRELRLVLARRATELAVREALADTDGRARAAAFEAALRTFPDERAERLSWALSDPMPGLAERDAVTLRALELVAAHGLPPVRLEGYAESLHARILDILAERRGGPVTVAACRALAKIEGRPESLRPETWLVQRLPSRAAPTPP
ncbi:MAG TPA: hypothetical protein VF530_22230 [Planctomycetota bacterium]